MRSALHFVRSNALFLAAAAIVLSADQVTKYVVVRSLAFGESLPVEGIFRLTYVHNTGGAFGLFQNQNTALALTAVVGALALFFLYRYRVVHAWWLRLSLGLQLGGALGNLVDRARLGYVVDFIDWGWWPVFNVADASITTGIVVLVVFLILFPMRQGQGAGTAGRPGLAAVDAAEPHAAPHN